MNAPEDRPPDASSPDISPPSADTRGTQVQSTPPSHAFQPAGLPVVPGYLLHAEIGRGGMGVVYRALDTALARNVAIKILQNRYPPTGEAASRFVEEAQITSQLQHPGIPPIHQVGVLADGRPFLAMKLIKGDTLHKLLKERLTPDQDCGRFLAVFEQICQAVGYAHAHGVVHRDLKPANVMVGAFGEVQVMDWGLSKSIRDSRPTEARTEVEEAHTAIGSLRDASSATRTGSVMGTPAYMPPEQAGGEIAKIDARSDVFSLGAVLCVVLTGRPPYVAGDEDAVQLMAVRAELGGAQARLEVCGAEPELIALCERCLAVQREDRPKDANELAATVASFRLAAEDRARQAELDRVRAEGEQAKAEAEAREQRKRRKAQLALAVSLALLLAAGGGFAWYLDRQAGAQKLKDERTESERKASEAALKGEADAERRFKAAQARQGVRANLTLARDLRKQYKFKAADAALAQAAALAKGGAPELLPVVEQARSDLAFVVKLDDIRYRKWAYIAEPGGKGHFHTKIAAPEYHQAFAERGLDLVKFAPDEAAKRIAASAVKAELVAAVDDWALYESNDMLRDRLLEIARAAAPGEWTDRLRDPKAWSHKPTIAKLAADPAHATASSAALSLLAELMYRNSLNPAPLLTSTRARHPTDFELAFAHGLWHMNSKDGQQIGPFEAARALRPENVTVWTNLGAALANKGEHDGVIVVYKEAIRLDPKDARSHYNLGVALDAKGDRDGAIAAFREAIRRDPKLATAYNNLGVALRVNGDQVGAITAFKEAIKRNPQLAQAHSNLAVIYLGQKKYAEGIVCTRAAIKADPKLSNAHALLGFALQQTGDIPGARVALTEAARLDKRWASLLAKLPPIPVAPAPREVKWP